MKAGGGLLSREAVTFRGAADHGLPASAGAERVVLSVRRLTKALAAVFILTGPACAATLHVVERAETDATHVHGGTAADNAGDILTFANPVFDAANRTRIGSDQGYCVRVVVGKAYECHFTVVLGAGQIAVDGPFYDDADSRMAVTGGTGAYAGARGEMGLHARDAHQAAFDFTFDLLGR